jgi:hypothetical protein
MAQYEQKFLQGIASHLATQTALYASENRFSDAILAAASWLVARELINTIVVRNAAPRELRRSERNIVVGYRSPVKAQMSASGE